MLENVLKTIAERSEAEKQEILLAKEFDLKKLEGEFKKDLQVKKTRQEALLKKNTELEIQEVLKKKELSTRFILEKKKKELIDSVYQAVKNKIFESNDKDFTSLIEFFLENTPKQGGVFRAGKRTSEILKKKGCIVKEIVKQEGFVFESEKLDIDCTLEQFILRQIECFDPKIIEILFE